MSIVPLHKIPTRIQAQGIVRELAIKGKVRWSKHARKRMAERKVNDKQVLTCLERAKLLMGQFWQTKVMVKTGMILQ